ncbi:Phosphoglycerol transferase MdoB [Ruminococcaceae bacterium FB2012]|nr:Phosphoglycerol transferase MdoB [Ruminococcaceae bacterium FB2012]
MKGFLVSVRDKAKIYISRNLMFITFVVTSVVNSFLLRAFTVGFNYSFIKPVLADIAVVLFFALFGYCFRPKRRFPYFLVLNILFTVLTIGNCIYFTNYKSFLSISLISTASQLGGVMGAVTNLLEVKQFVFLWSIIAQITVYVLIKKKKPDYFDEIEKLGVGRKYAISTLAAALGTGGIFAATLTGTDVSRLAKQWNREYVLGTFGQYTYQISDTVSSLHAKMNMWLGYDENKQAFTEFYTEKTDSVVTEGKNEYSDIFKGKNVIVIHAESIQQFTLDTFINGEPLTPNLRKLAGESLYFSNFYAQESVGTSSDSEFTFSSSLMPASSGTVAINYWDRDYTTTQSMLGDRGYYVFSMHGNNGSYWNRLNLHKSLGYDRLFNYTDDFVIDETIGLGLSDKSFFRQAIPKIKEISREHKNFYGTLIMLTNHTPFTDIERVSNYQVDFKYRRTDPETGVTEQVSAPFLEGTKLGSYFKSVHYADEAIGQLISDLDSEGLLDNTVIVLYGDHDAKVKEEQFEYYYNYNPFTEEVLTAADEGYIPVDDFYYNLNRKVPFMIWSKDLKEPKEITKVMGMYDVQPTLGNMFGFENSYALGHDIFSIPENEENVVIFPNGNFVTDTVYYNNQKGTYFDVRGYDNVAKHASCNQNYKDTPNPLYSGMRDANYKKLHNTAYGADAAALRTNDGAVDEAYISRYVTYAEERINISNAIIYYDMINKTAEGWTGEAQTVEARKGVFAPPNADKRERIYSI